MKITTQQAMDLINTGSFVFDDARETHMGIGIALYDSKNDRCLTIYMPYANDTGLSMRYMGVMSFLLECYMEMIWSGCNLEE